ncbi:MAG: hypothetical protein CVU65_17495 [Deltaproteobacteria bacterium HGW-Deltaproteobacteria-22]|nr:MAG: hypothetical protein CVU65_17495 [Deltaproteobacteria bacterium HGW-Deltaproteobacteria-22]
MHCPKDQSEMFKKNYEKDVEVDICTECGGIWLDHGELEAIQSIRENDYREQVKEAPNFLRQAEELARQKESPLLTCPHCAVEMARREYGYTSQILIDVCSYCGGVWLDPGELSALEIFFERSRVEAANRPHWILAGIKKLLASD